MISTHNFTQLYPTCQPTLRKNVIRLKLLL